MNFNLRRRPGVAALGALLAGALLTVVALVVSVMAGPIAPVLPPAQAAADECEIGGRTVSSGLDATTCSALEAVLEIDGPVEPADPCDWSGVGCSRTGDQILVLRFGAPSPELSPAIGALSNLIGLQIVNDGVALRQLPEQIGRLTELRMLSAEGHDLTSVPDDLGELDRLVTLSLSANEFEVVPAAFAALVSLENLDLSDNELVSIGNALSRVSSLRRLDVSGNGLTSIPTWMAGMESLAELIADDNLIVTMPAMTNLRRLSLRSNQIFSPPSALGQAAALESLDLRDNRMTSVPASMRGLVGLERLILDGNRLTSVDVLAELPNLRTVNLASNALSEIPSGTGTWPMLRSLDLEGNRLDVPPDLARVSGLVMLDLDENMLSGDITYFAEQWLTLDSLRRLELDDGAGGNDCLTVSSDTVARAISDLDSQWDRCDGPPSAMGIAGTVLNTDRVPMFGMTVCVIQTGFATSNCDLTNSMGQFDIGLRYAGNYRLSVVDRGRRYETIFSDTLGVSQGAYVTGVEVTVVPRVESTPTPGPEPTTAPTSGPGSTPTATPTPPPEPTPTPTATPGPEPTPEPTPTPTVGPSPTAGPTPFPQSMITGRVAQPSGHPVPDVEVCAVRSMFGTESCDETGDDGRYSLSPLSVGNYVLEVNDPDGVWQLEEPYLVGIRSSDGLHNIELVVVATN